MQAHHTASMFVSALLTGATMAQPIAAESLEQRVADRIEPHLSDVPGVSVAIVDAEGNTHAVAAGLARRNPAIALDESGRMFSGSIGKTYCAAVLMQLVDAGELELDGLISEHLGDRDWFGRLPNAGDITVRHLANHQSGIPEHVWMPAFADALGSNPDKAWTPDEIVAFVLDSEPRFPAGEGFSYADTNYILLGAVIERVTGERYEDLLDRRVLEPLGLRDTITSSQPELPGLVSGYTRLHAMFPVREEVAADGVYCMNPQFEWTGGGVVSTSSDLARFMHEFCTGEIVSDEARAEMMSFVPAPQLGPGVRYGVGLFTRETEGGVMHGHTGIFPGFLSGAWHLPESGVTFAVQVNSDEPAAGRALDAITEEIARIARALQTP